MALRQYSVIHGREYKGVIYKISHIPSQDHYVTTFSDPRITKITGGGTGTTMAELENDAREHIDKFQNSNK